MSGCESIHYKKNKEYDKLGFFKPAKRFAIWKPGRMTAKENQRVDDHNYGMEIHRLLGQGGNMNNSLKNSLIMLLVSLLLFGCVTPTVWIADPKIQRIQNPSYGVEFEPLREEATLFKYFRLSVTNKTGRTGKKYQRKNQIIAGCRTSIKSSI